MERIIRNSCKAIVIKDGKLLTLKKSDIDGIYNVLPGGGQIWGESLIETLKRECFEEIGTEPKIIGRLLFIRESYKTKNGITNGKYYHRVDYLFECEVDEEKVKNGNLPDENQIGIEWIDLGNRLEEKLFPKGIGNYIIKYAKDGIIDNPYLGIID